MGAEFGGLAAIVTGGASGIGQATAGLLAARGATGVVVADADEQRGRETVGTIRARTGCDVRLVRVDVSREDQVAAMVKETVAAFGRIDVLVNNASICPVAEWDDASVEDWNRVLAVNLTGMYLCTRAVVPHMRKARSGRIVFVASTAALQGSFIAHPAYGASKAGCISLMKSVAKSFAAEGILANAVVPGPIDTPLSAGFTDEQRRAFAEATLLKRYGKAEEVAEAIAFLASPRSGYITGSTVHVSGGQVLA
jgi:3-oxoacyl-[acyl-carrier protein] reductase